MFLKTARNQNGLSAPLVLFAVVVSILLCFSVLSLMGVNLTSYFKDGKSQKGSEFVGGTGSGTAKVNFGSGYVQMDPSKKGFIFEDGAKFIPNAPNLFRLIQRAYIDDSTSGREYVQMLGAYDSRDSISSYDCKISPSSSGFTYDEFFKESAAKGVTGYRVFIDGGEGSPRSGSAHLGLEPIPVGKYYVYDECLTGGMSQAKDPNSAISKAQIDGKDFLTNYPNCRYPNFTDANCGSVYGPKLRKSLVTRMLTAADKYNVKVRVVLFSNSELRVNDLDANWQYATYNSANGGPASTPQEFFSNPLAIQYQKQRIKFFNQVWGDSPAIWNWDIYNELNFSSGNTSEIVAWVKDIATYIKSVDSHKRPVSFSSWEDPAWAYGSRANSAYLNPSLDFVDFHVYSTPLLSERLAYYNDIEKTYSKVFFSGEFWPFNAQNGPVSDSGLLVEDGLKQSPPSEARPYRPSLTHVWLQLAGSGSSVAQRWQDTGLSGVSGLDKYVLSSLYNPTAKFIEKVNWGGWDFSKSTTWDSKITISSSDFKVARGDGDQVMLFIHGTSDSSNITVSSLASGTYTVSVFDFITGNLVSSTKLNSNGSLSYGVNLSNSYLDIAKDGHDRKRFAVLLFEKDFAPTPTPVPTSTLTPTPASTPVATPVPQGQVILDDAGSEFSTSYSDDAWAKYTQSDGIHYGGSHFYNRLIGTGKDVAKWTFNLDKDGEYEVYGWWWSSTYRPTDVPYVISSLDGAKTVKVNQQLNGGKWNLLGKFSLPKSGSISILDSASSGKDVVADAVMLKYIGPVPSQNKAISFSSTTSYVVVPKSANSNLDFGTGDFTIEAWIKTTTTRNQTILIKGGDADYIPGYWLWLSGDGSIRLSFGNGVTRSWARSNTNLNMWDGVWHHLAVSVSRSSVATFYKDGVAVGSYDVTKMKDQSITSSKDLSLNIANDPSYSLVGQLDEVRLWKVARTSSQITSGYKSSVSSSDPSLVGYWKLDDGIGSTAKDSTANLKHGTLTSVSWVEGFK